MAEVEVEQFDKPADERDRSVGMALAETAGFIADYRSAGFEQGVRDTADAVARNANETRFAAEGLAGQSADPLMDAAMGREEFLVAQGTRVSDQARKSFGRYKQAIEQGASNKSAARIAVQKEMRDMISNNPVYADVIRQAAAEAMGEEEFLVLTRDLNVREKSQTETEFAKSLREAGDVAAYMASKNNWDQRTHDKFLTMAQDKVYQRYALTQSAELLSTSEEIAGLNTRRGVQVAITVSQDKADGLFGQAMNMLTAGPGGLSLGIEQVNNLKTLADREIFQLEGLLRRELAGKTADVTQLNEQIAQATLPLRQLRTMLDDKNVGSRLAEMKTALENGAHVSAAQLLPVMTSIRTVFGDDMQYVLKALERDDSIANEVFRNSPIFSDINRMFPDMDITQKRQLALDQMSRSTDALLGGAPMDSSLRDGTRGYLGIRYNSPVKTRNEDERYGNVVQELARRGDPLVGAELARTQQPDKHQLAAATLWHDNFKANVQSAKSIGEAWLKGAPDGERDYRVVVQESAGTPIIMIQRYQLGREFDAAGKETTTWRNSPIPMDSASESFRGLFQPFKIDNAGTRRSAIENPAIYQHIFKDSTMDVPNKIRGYLNEANASSKGLVE